MTSFDLGLLPSGHLHCFPSDADDATDKAVSVGKAFRRSSGEGLFALAARRNGTDLTPSLQYWRNFARLYMSERCLMPRASPQQPEPVQPFTDIETMPLLMAVSPMRGAEYLSPAGLVTGGGL